jgi:outer membrane protein TolC
MRETARSVWIAVLLLAGLSAGCIKYRPKPLDPSATAKALEERSLSDPGLQAYVEKTSAGEAGSWPPATWDFESLLKAALYFSPDLARAQADVVSAQAEAYAAGVRQDPALSISLEHRVNHLEGAPASTWGPTLDIPLTTWGKRGIRQAEAGAKLRESEFLLTRAAWQARSELRRALVAFQGAKAQVGAAGALAASRRKALALMEARLAEGEASAPEVEFARSDAAAAELAFSKARGAEAGARSDLARALGVPEGALPQETPNLLEEPLPDSPAGPQAREAALTGRSDLLAALSAYAASDQALRLAVREQYPDLHLSPGYLWDQGADAWVLGLSTLLPLVNRNRRGIAKAEAAREAEGNRVLALQEAILHEVEGTQSAYIAARESVKRAEAQARSRRKSLEASRAAFAAGEEDALALALAQSGFESARLEALGARRTAWDALGRLEDALELPILPDAPLPPLPRGETAKESSP